MNRSLIRPVVLGGADGAVIVMGLIVGLAVSRQSPSAVWHAALAGGLAELVGMTAGMWLSEGDSGFTVALACGAAAFLACTAPAIPYAVTGGTGALCVSLGLVLTAAGVIHRLRPERGLLAVLSTFGVLAAAAVLTGAVALI